MTYEQALERAFYAELAKIAGEGGLPLDELTKQAFIGQALRAAGRKVRGAADVLRGAPIKTNVLDPATGAPLSIATHKAGTQSILGGTGKSLQESGDLLMKGPRKVEGISQAEMGRMGMTQPGAAGRVGGQVLHDIGHHVSHKGVVGNVLNPFGSLLGGTAEGLTRAAGKEAVRAGQAVGGRAGGALQSTGRGLQKAAPVAGIGGEIGGLAGLGTVAGVPLSVAGAAGGKMMALAPGIEHAVEQAGHFAAHAAHDAAGTAAGKARRVFSGIGSRLRRPVPAPAGAVA